MTDMALSEDIIVYRDPRYLDHDTGPGHPERADRLRAIGRWLDSSGLSFHNPSPCEDATLLRVHPQAHLDRIAAARPESGLSFLDPDTPVSPGSETAARLAVGAVCQGVDRVLDGPTKRVFCAARPPGHHAEPSRAMGFCLYSTVAIGAKHALDARGLGRVAIVDFDVHHGNGTEAVARQDPRMLFISTHEWGNYPGTGHPDDHGQHDNLLNFALPRGASGKHFRPIFEREIIPALERFSPDLFLLSAGFDGHRADPLGGLNLEAEDFGWMTRLLAEAADRLCGGRIVSSLEGGYDLAALSESTAAHVEALATK